VPICEHYVVRLTYSLTVAVLPINLFFYKVVYSCSLRVVRHLNAVVLKRFLPKCHKDWNTFGLFLPKYIIQYCTDAVECATARISTQTGLISWTKPGTNPARGAKIKSGAYAIGLISWAASDGSTVSSLICDRWLIHKLATFVGSTVSLEC